MKAMVLGMLTITSIYSFASTKHSYIHCDKTYVDPFAHIEVSEEPSLEPSETPPINSDQLVQEIDLQRVVKQPPVVKRTAWPYCNKRR